MSAAPRATASRRPSCPSARCAGVRCCPLKNTTGGPRRTANCAHTWRGPSPRSSSVSPTRRPSSAAPSLTAKTPNGAICAPCWRRTASGRSSRRRSPRPAAASRSSTSRRCGACSSTWRPSAPRSSATPRRPTGCCICTSRATAPSSPPGRPPPSTRSWRTRRRTAPRRCVRCSATCSAARPPRGRSWSGSRASSSSGSRSSAAKWRSAPTSRCSPSR
mmetsp:Transcript_26995/g.83575  ORF Transcript_26995/g.83575 Transcript_26995/m.83575 type:complete len:218 (+) Transcript_26995:1010-1663(+)